jgi:hypothetical protein
MSAELVLTAEVRCWVDRVAPGDHLLADVAVSKALSSYGGGASVSESCQEARRLVGCRVRHPSSPSTSAHKKLSLAC